MIGQMSANQLIKSVQRYVAKIQGTKQYWFQLYQEFKALITQKGAPTFFFTLELPITIGQIYTDFFKSQKNAVPSVRIRVVIDHLHITDAYFVSMSDELCTH